MIKIPKKILYRDVIMKPKARRTTTLCINSHAGGIAFVRPNGFGIDFVRYSISGSALWFFVFILKFIFRLIFKIKIMKKNPWHQKNFIFEGRFLITIIYLSKLIGLTSPFRQPRQYLTPTAWELSSDLKSPNFRREYVKQLNLNYRFITVPNSAQALCPNYHFQNSALIDRHILKRSRFHLTNHHSRYMYRKADMVQHKTSRCCTLWDRCRWFSRILHFAAQFRPNEFHKVNDTIWPLAPQEAIQSRLL